MADPVPTDEEVISDLGDRPVVEGSRLYCRDWWGEGHSGVRSCFLWRVERSAKTGRLMLVAEGIKKRLPLTQGRVDELIVYRPADGATLADCPEEWSWWRSLDWGLVLRSTLPTVPDGEWGSEVQAYHGEKSRGLHFVAASWALLQKHPIALRRLLGEALYYLVHPRKARALGILGEDRLPDEVYLPFVAQMRQRAKKLGFS